MVGKDSMIMLHLWTPSTFMAEVIIQPSGAVICFKAECGGESAEAHGSLNAE